MTSEELVQGGAMAIGEAREFTGLSQSYLYLLMDRGELEYTKLGKRRLIPRNALTGLLQRGLVSREAAAV